MDEQQTDLPYIPGYEVLRVLGQGGMATVYLAIQESFGRPVALKVMSPELLVNRDFVNRFMAEARMVASLAHPNIITVYDVGQYEQYYYLAMEYHTEGHLGQKIERGEITPRQALEITRDLAGALTMAHENGIVHRDIKPDNVLFSKHGMPILTDFGIARDVYVDTQMTQVGSTVGTPKYMSPEQARGERVDGRADLYSLGVMLYEMLTGRPPFTAQDTVTLAIKHCQEAVPPLPIEVNRYQPLLDRLLAKSPAYRFQNGNEVREAISQLLQAPQRLAPEQVSYEDLPVRPVASAPELVLMPESAARYDTVDEESGGFFTKKITRTVSFSANDYDEFAQAFQRMSDELILWRQKNGKKADKLRMVIEAHPWIHKRIIDKVRADFSPGHGYGDFARTGTIQLHLYDPAEPEGKRYTVRDKGVPTGQKKPG